VGDSFIATVPIGRCYQAMRRSVSENAADADEARFALVAASVPTLTFALKRAPRSWSRSTAASTAPD
jgi:hypothetical protein